MSPQRLREVNAFLQGLCSCGLRKLGIAPQFFCFLISEPGYLQSLHIFLGGGRGGSRYAAVQRTPSSASAGNHCYCYFLPGERRSLPSRVLSDSQQKETGKTCFWCNNLISQQPDFVPAVLRRRRWAVKEISPCYWGEMLGKTQVQTPWPRSRRHVGVLHTTAEAGWMGRAPPSAHRRGPGSRIRAGLPAAGVWGGGRRCHFYLCPQNSNA